MLRVSVVCAVVLLVYAGEREEIGLREHSGLPCALTRSSRDFPGRIAKVPLPQGHERRLPFLHVAKEDGRLMYVESLRFVS